MKRDSPVTVSMSARRPVYLDRFLLALITLLAAVLVGYVSGLLPYPFGVVVLACLCAARVFHLRRKA